MDILFLAKNDKDVISMWSETITDDLRPYLSEEEIQLNLIKLEKLLVSFYSSLILLALFSFKGKKKSPDFKSRAQTLELQILLQIKLIKLRRKDPDNSKIAISILEKLIVEAHKEVEDLKQIKIVDVKYSVEICLLEISDFLQSSKLHTKENAIVASTNIPVKIVEIIIGRLYRYMDFPNVNFKSDPFGLEPVDKIRKLLIRLRKKQFKKYSIIDAGRFRILPFLPNNKPKKSGKRNTKKKQ